MKSRTKTICTAAGIAGAFLLSGAAAILLIQSCKNDRGCCVFLCDNADDPVSEADDASCSPSESEVKGNET